MTGNIAYLDCFSGLAGDMLLAALLDAGLPLEHLRRQLAGLPLKGYELEGQRTSQGGISALNFQVKLTGQQPPRTWREIRELLTAAELDQEVKEKAIPIFQHLAEAEARVHGVAVEEVHFHEVGAVDSLVDIVGAAIGLAYFKIDRLLCSPLPLTRGWVHTSHGPLPLPAPATMELLRDLPTYGLDLEMELVTPTGAALVKALATACGPPPPMTIRHLGYGAGSKQRPDGKPNLLRLLVGTAEQPAEAQSIEVIETQLDDWSAESFPHLCERLLTLGSLDVSLTPLLMKKGRPGYLLRVLADPAQARQLKECLLSETTAIGLRFRWEQRLTLPREMGTVTTPWGEIAVKKVTTPRGVVIYPEYESCRQAALQYQVPLLQIHTLVAAMPPEQCQPREDSIRKGSAREDSAQEDYDG
ncbi:nickel pincer cofactor biosynthesis protein LarC [Desulfurivibrio dismutans]|uniref:nickel pincer cofactor biosynthesis protein LarC n=1 Tax=Desulfurivibrio dismutans TaxID=1398908 RepID=UPI0023DACB3C|nr:nickel pincer cofactor biosynthesis protein LarC [Desulfurivibrio alkaliphilus]MDF1614581.1 nickel pincer cofactor biosynthesis protein LarC [Desulfurivibrio alkaliphilus]